MKIGCALLPLLTFPALAWADPVPVVKRDYAVAPTSVTAIGSTARVNSFVRVETETPRMTEAFSRGLQHELEQDRTAAAFGVAYIPVASRAQVFARVGYGGGAGASQATTSEGLKYGIGAEYSMGSRNGFRADYTRHDADRARPKADVFSLGFAGKF